MQRMRLFTFGDLVLIITLLLSGAAVIPFIHALGPATMIIYRDNRIVAEYPLDHDRTVNVQGVGGPMLVAITAGRVSVQGSSCARHVCMHRGAISRPFQQLICAPNHVLIEIRAKGREERIDAIAQ